jgi:hypothetical protein
MSDASVIDRMRLLLDNIGADDTVALAVSDRHGNTVLLAYELTRETALSFIRSLADEDNWP